MSAIEIGCKKCGSEDFSLVNPSTGEMLCSFCRNRWIEPSLIQRTETEKFLAEQAKRPQVVIDNTTETDKQLMDMASKAFGMATGGCARRATGIIVIVLVVIALIIGMVFFSLGSFMLGR